MIRKYHHMRLIKDPDFGFIFRVHDGPIVQALHKVPDCRQRSIR